ncbi:hypothetical protein LTR08_005729 [Meristemomyces frigidus]|nr:hypothetical protein LTR08_005729 [Meristemomyces frigidus]
MAEDTLVDYLRNIQVTCLWAFRDSPIDLPMLSKADRAIVVVGQVNDRSNTMEEELTKVMDVNGLRASQVLRSGTASPRLDSTRLAVIQLADLASPLCGRLRALEATNRTAAKLLMTPIRDATIAGPALRAAHRNVEWYLATEFVAGIVGLGKCVIQHIQSNNTKGHRLLHEAKNTIVALLRGGEPMAFAVNDAVPLAGLVHAHQAADIELDRDLRGVSTDKHTNALFNSTISAIQDAPSPAKRYAERMTRTFESPHSENVTLRKQVKSRRSFFTHARLDKKASESN